MGCHTWFYKKINVSYEEAKEIYIKNTTESIDRLEKWLNNPTSEEYLEVVEDYPEYTLEYMVKELAIYKRKRRIVEKGLCKEAVLRSYFDPTFKTTFKYIKGKGHFQSLDWCDIFRIGNYPEDRLFSLEETLDFIKRNEDKIYDYNNNKTTWLFKLEQFWKDYPDGMVSFG